MNRIEDVYGLTPVQEGIYAQYFQNKTTDAYRLYFLFSLNRDTDLSVLRRALALLPVRHPVLKTAFAAAQGTVKQVILADRTPAVSIRDFNAPYTPEALERAIGEEKSKPMDLQRDSLVRCVVFVFSDVRFLLLHTHHMIIDGWCAAVLAEDLSACYNALAAGESAEALRLRLAAEQKAETSFAAYANLIRRRDRGEALEYWRRLLADAAPAPLPKRRAAAEPDEVRRISLAVPQETVSRLRAFARTHALPLNTLLESAFALALQKHTGGKDAVFFKVISGRSFGLAGTGRTVGPMINTVPARGRRAEGDTLRQFLNMMNEQSVSVGEFGFLPLSGVCRSCGFNPNAVDALFDFGNYPVADQAEEQRFRLLEQSEQTEFPLTCVVAPAGDGLILHTAYRGAVIPPALAQAFADSFLYILGNLSAAAETDLDSAAFLDGLLRLTPAERRRIFGADDETAAAGFCAGERLPIPDKSVYALFAEQAAASPEKPAVIFKDRAYSFRELLDLADAAADRLAAAEVRADDTVAVHLNRSPLLIVLQLAVLKLGAVFLPVDKRYPESRVRFLCRDCAARLLITDEAGFAADETPLLTPQALAQGNGHAPHVPETRRENCYIIYTSGSTGAPKGCMLRQTGLVNFCVNNNTLKTLKQRHTNVFASVNSVSFDYFIAESLLPLLNGYTVALCDEDESLLQRLFLAAVRRYGVNVLMTTPTRLSLFYDPAQDCMPLQGLDCVCSSGEPLPENLLERICAVSPNAKIYNPLGPSECTVWDLGGELDRAAGTDVHLGRPIANTRAYILNEALQPVSVGVIGELCIAGAGVGGGYVNRPALTVERFLNDPFGEGRLYRTGDLAYWREDGNVAFAGRNDYQIKLNGLRIEPGEIEAALTAIEGVDSAAVTLHTENSRQTLCAFYTGHTSDVSALRRQLGGTLPQYMTPHTFIKLEKMPLTASGKIDRRALKDLAAAPLPAVEAFSPPQTATEKAICALFAETLGQKEPGREADFFRLGGTSLQLVGLLSRPPLDRLTPSDFLKDPTPAGLAKMLDAPRQKDYSYLVPLYTPAEAKKAFVLFPFAGGNAAAYTALVGKARQRRGDIALYFVDWPDTAALPAIAREIEKTASAYPVYFYSHCAGASIALSLLDMLNEKSPVIKGYIAGAVIPPRKALAGFNMWAYMSDGAIEKALSSAGLRLNAGGADALRQRLGAFRAHTKVSSAYFGKKTEKTKVSVTVILSKADPFTPKTADAGAHWQRIVSHVDRVILIDTPSHYFQNTDTDLLLDLFSDIK